MTWLSATHAYPHANNGSLRVGLRHAQRQELVGWLAGEEGGQALKGGFFLKEDAVELFGDGHFDAVASGKLASSGCGGHALGYLTVHDSAHFLRGFASRQFL